MLNLKALMVGFGFLLVVIIFLTHKIKTRSANKKRIEEIKRRRKKKIKKRS